MYGSLQAGDDTSDPLEVLSGLDRDELGPEEMPDAFRADVRRKIQCMIIHLIIAIHF